MRLGKRLRGPSLQFIGGHGDAGLDDVRRCRGEVELVGRGVGGAGHLVVAETIGGRVAVVTAGVDAEQVVRLRHDVHDRHADVRELQARVADARRRLALVDRHDAHEVAAGDGHDVAVVDRVPVAGHVERVDGVDVVVEVAARLRVAEAVDVLHGRAVAPPPAVVAAPVGQRVGAVAATHERADLAVDVPGEPVLGAPRAGARRVDGRHRVLAVARVVERQRVGERERAVARGVELLQCQHVDRLVGDADPGVAVADHLAVGHRPADVEVELVGRVEHLDDDVAAEARGLRGPPHEDAGGVRRVRRAHDGRTWGRPRVDVGLAADEVLVLDVAHLREVLGDERVVGGAEGIRGRGDRQRPGHVGQGRSASTRSRGGRSDHPQRDARDDPGEAPTARPRHPHTSCALRPGRSRS